MMMMTTDPMGPDDVFVPPADAADGERCGRCKGFGLVRGVGERKGRAYRSFSGAQASLAGGRADDCPACEGVGLVNLQPLVVAA